MAGKLMLYVVDTETTSMDIAYGDIIEISFLRISDGQQRTWHLKSVNPEHIEEEALSVNGHKREDITWYTEEGKKKYRFPEEVLPEMENWIAEDNAMSLDRVLAGHNISFDESRMRELWSRCGASDSFPFGTHSIDTKSLAIFSDWVAGGNNERYSLSQLVKRLGLPKRKAHEAEQDVLMTKDLLEHYADAFRKKG